MRGGRAGRASVRRVAGQPTTTPPLKASSSFRSSRSDRADTVGVPRHGRYPSHFSRSRWWLFGSGNFLPSLWFQGSRFPMIEDLVNQAPFNTFGRWLAERGSEWDGFAPPYGIFLSSLPSSYPWSRLLAIGKHPSSRQKQLALVAQLSTVASTLRGAWLSRSPATRRSSPSTSASVEFLVSVSPPLGAQGYGTWNV